MTDSLGAPSAQPAKTVQSAQSNAANGCTDYMVVLVTCPGEKANSIAQTLIGESLCACVNILPNIRSVYRWQGDVTSEEESLLVMKTMGKIYDRLEARIKEIHP
jgi:periplasmic divalent cation tolerance protein